MVSTLKAIPFSLLHPTWAVGEAELLESILECVGAGEGCSCFHGKAMENRSSQCGCSVQAVSLALVSLCLESEHPNISYFSYSCWVLLFLSWPEVLE